MPNSSLSLAARLVFETPVFWNPRWTGQRTSMYGETLLLALAAAYAYGLVRNHPFANKRAAFMAMTTFLARNKQPIKAPPIEAADKIVRLASGDLSEADLAAWIASYLP